MGNDDVEASAYVSVLGKEITLAAKSGNYVVTSFKLNGGNVTGNSFIMRNENVEITDIEVAE